MNTLEYKGYKAIVRFDGEDEILVGNLVGLNDVVGFHADSVAALKSAFIEAVDDYVATCEKAGKKPEKPYSGNLMLRIDPTVHRDAALAALLAGKSLNQWGEEVLRKAASAIGTGHAASAQSETEKETSEMEWKELIREDVIAHVRGNILKEPILREKSAMMEGDLMEAILRGDYEMATKKALALKEALLQDIEASREIAASGNIPASPDIAALRKRKA